MTEDSNNSADESGESEEDFTYIVDGYLVRSKTFTDNGKIEEFEPGDPIEPTERELELYSDKLLKVDSDGQLINAKRYREKRELTPEEKTARKYRRRHGGR